MATDPLEGMLQRCSLHALLMVTSTALSRNGFGDVEILDRRRSKQKSRFGGHELQCQTSLGGQPVRVLVKVIQDRVRTRMVHEMAGCVIDYDGDFGLVISPFNSSPLRARKQPIDPKLKVRIIEGHDLAQLLRCSGVGVRPGGGIDYAYFASVEAASEHILTFIEMVR